MPRAFESMMDNLAQNPAGGFQAFLNDQEATALAEVRLGPEEERRIGRKARDEFVQQARARGHAVVSDPKRLNYLRTLVDRFALRMAHRDRYPRIDVTLIDVPVADGQSFPGGFLVFTTALLKEPDEATVAGVVAHELAHLDRGHLYEYAKRTRLSETAFQPPANGFGPEAFDRFMTQGMAVGSLMMNPFRPEHELEADCLAVSWLYIEGYDPAALAGFFERLHERLRDEPDQPFFQIARSHPYSLNRRREVLDRSRQLQRWRPRRDLGLFPENLRRLEPQGALAEEADDDEDRQ